LLTAEQNADAPKMHSSNNAYYPPIVPLPYAIATVMKYCGISEYTFQDSNIVFTTFYVPLVQRQTTTKVRPSATLRRWLGMISPSMMPLQRWLVPPRSGNRLDE